MKEKDRINQRYLRQIAIAHSLEPAKQSAFPQNEFPQVGNPTLTNEEIRIIGKSGGLGNGVEGVRKASIRDIENALGIKR